MVHSTPEQEVATRVLSATALYICYDIERSCHCCYPRLPAWSHLQHPLFELKGPTSKQTIARVNNISICTLLQCPTSSCPVTPRSSSTRYCTMCTSSKASATRGRRLHSSTKKDSRHKRDVCRNSRIFVLRHRPSWRTSEPSGTDSRHYQCQHTVTLRAP
jgi:hypothetical protein